MNEDETRMEEDLSNSTQADGVTATPPAEPTGKARKNFMAVLFLKWKEKMADRIQKRLEKVMELVMQKGKITNEDICKLLRVSRQSGQRYCDKLEQQGRIRQVGKAGREVFYEPA